MKFTFETKTKVTPEKIWFFYEDVNKWFTWEDDLKDISLNGDFVTGSIGSMTLDGMPPMTFTLTEVIPNKLFTDKTVIEGVGELYFIHELNNVDGFTTVRHSVEFISENGKDTLKDSQFVSQVFSDVPASIFKLIEVANG